MIQAQPHRFEAVADGIFCIDTDLYRPGLAAAYLVRFGGRLAYIETGTARSVPGLLAVIDAIGATPEQVDYVIPTHVHLDHAGGAGDLIAACPNARLVVHPRGAQHLIDPEKLTAGATAVYGAEAFSRDFGALTPVPADRVVIAEDGEVIDLAGRALTFFDTPGHANHHGCVYDAQSRGVFSGDTFGIGYPELASAAGPWLFPPTTPVAFDPDAWQQSLDRILGFDPEMIFLTHYGRIDKPEQLVDDLRTGIRDMARIALAQEGSDDGGRQDRLKEAVARYLVDGARAHGCTLDENSMREVLAVDIDLNAQGLEVWLRRRAKRAVV